jgi:AcrR family transcriptional regulator
MPEADKRTRLVESAVKLVYEQGFEETSLADIAKDAGVPLGNVYYYFKTKEELGEALIDQLAAAQDAAFAQFEKKSDPRARIDAVLQTYLKVRDAVARSGCQLGSLSTELHKKGGDLAGKSTQLYDKLLTWLAAQFRLLGKEDAVARDLAAHLVSSMEGASLLTHTFNDDRYLTREAAVLRAWLRSL